MDILTGELCLVIAMLLIALFVLIRLLGEEICEDIEDFKRRNRWRLRYKHRKRRK